MELKTAIVTALLSSIGQHIVLVFSTCSLCLCQFLGSQSCERHKFVFRLLIVSELVLFVCQALFPVQSNDQEVYFKEPRTRNTAPKCHGDPILFKMGTQWGPNFE